MTSTKPSGVALMKRNQRYRAYLYCNRRQINIGSYATEAEARAALKGVDLFGASLLKQLKALQAIINTPLEI